MLHGRPMLDVLRIDFRFRYGRYSNMYAILFYLSLSYLYLFKFLLYINKFGLHFECVACVQAVFLGCILQPDVYTLVIRTPQENYICICIVSGYKFLSSYVVKLLEKMTNLAGILAFLDGNKFRKVTRSTLGKDNVWLLFVLGKSTTQQKLKVWGSPFLEQ